MKELEEIKKNFDEFMAKAEQTLQRMKGTKIQKNIDNMEKDFDVFSQHAKEFIQKYGNPHTKIIVEQDGIEIVDGVKVKPFELKAKENNNEHKSN